VSSMVPHVPSGVPWAAKTLVVVLKGYMPNVPGTAEVEFGRRQAHAVSRNVFQ
jgi:hypothetical protein